MSLFKAREWWSTTSGYEEFHDLGNLCIGNLDNSTPPCSKLDVLSELHFNILLCVTNIHNKLIQSENVYPS